MILRYGYLSFYLASCFINHRNPERPRQICLFDIHNSESTLLKVRIGNVCLRLTVAGAIKQFLFSDSLAAFCDNSVIYYVWFFFQFTANANRTSLYRLKFIYWIFIDCLFNIGSILHYRCVSQQTLVGMWVSNSYWLPVAVIVSFTEHFNWILPLYLDFIIQRTNHMALAKWFSML